MSEENTDIVQMQVMSFYVILLYSLVKIQHFKRCNQVKFHGQDQIFIFNAVSLRSFMWAILNCLWWRYRENIHNDIQCGIVLSLPTSFQCHFHVFEWDAVEIFQLMMRWKYFSKLNANKCLTGDVFSCPYPVKICSSKINFHFRTDRFGPYFWIIILMRSLSPGLCFIIIFMTWSCNHT